MMAKCPFCKGFMTANCGDTDKVNVHPVRHPSNRLVRRGLCLSCFYDLLSQNVELVEQLFDLRTVVTMEPHRDRLKDIRWPGNKSEFLHDRVYMMRKKGRLSFRERIRKWVR